MALKSGSSQIHSLVLHLEFGSPLPIAETTIFLTCYNIVGDGTLLLYLLGDPGQVTQPLWNPIEPLWMSYYNLHYTVVKIKISETCGFIIICLSCQTQTTMLSSSQKFPWILLKFFFFLWFANRMIRIFSSVVLSVSMFFPLGTRDNVWRHLCLGESLLDGGQQWCSTHHDA